MEGAHQDFMNGVQEYREGTPNYLMRQIIFFDEEIYRFISSFSQYYTHEELKSKISNWDYFEEKIQTLVSSDIASLHRSYALKFVHNRSEKEKVDRNLNYIPKYYSGPYIAPLTSDEGDFDVLLLQGNASHSLNCWSILGTENNRVPEIWINDHLIEVR